MNDALIQTIEADLPEELFKKISAEKIAEALPLTEKKRWGLLVNSFDVSTILLVPQIRKSGLEHSDGNNAEKVMKCVEEYKTISTDAITKALVLLGLHIEKDSKLEEKILERARRSSDKASLTIDIDKREKIIQDTKSAILLSMINTIEITEEEEPSEQTIACKHDVSAPMIAFK
jgi:hypothetical protein